MSREFFGVESPAGHTRNNLDALSYLACGLAGRSACNEEATPLAPGRRSFAAFLELGRMYE